MVPVVTPRHGINRAAVFGVTPAKSELTRASRVSKDTERLGTEYTHVDAVRLPKWALSLLGFLLDNDHFVDGFNGY